MFSNWPINSISIMHVTYTWLVLLHELFWKIKNSVFVKYSENAIIIWHLCRQNTEYNFDQIPSLVGDYVCFTGSILFFGEGISKTLFLLTTVRNLLHKIHTNKTPNIFVVLPVIDFEFWFVSYVNVTGLTVKIRF